MLSVVRTEKFRPETMDPSLSDEVKQAYIDGFRQAQDSTKGPGPKPQPEVDAVAEILEEEMQKRRFK